MDFLKSIRVIEFSHMVMGPSVGMILADLGADVIKIEPIAGDKTRKLPGSGAGFFAMFNRNKKSLCLDIKSAEGQAILQDLLKDADVMIENFRGGSLDKLGLGYNDVRAINPDIIYQSSKGFLSGPYEDRTALDEVAQMMGGLAYMTGPEGRPLRAGASVIDITGGMFGVIGVLAALLERQQLGQGGRHITSALFETTVFLVGQHMAQYAVTGTPARPMPSRISAWGIYDVFETSDGQMFVGVVSDGQWVTFCDVFGIADWQGKKAYATNTDRVAHRDEIIPALRQRFGTMTSKQLEAKLLEAGLPFAPINRPEDLASDPHVKAGALFDIGLPDEARSVALPKLPIECDGERDDIAVDPPKAGEDTDDILTELGYTPQQIAAWRATGVVA